MKVSREGCLLGVWIERRGWTQTKYAKLAGRSKRMISYFCNNERPMHPEDIFIALKLLDIEFDQLYAFTIIEDDE